MKCNELETYGMAYMDGTLARSESQAVERHLAACAACAERVRGFADVGRLLSTWEAIQPSASFNARLERRITEHYGEQPATAAGWWQRLMQFGWTPLARPALGVLAMALFAVLVVRYLPTTPGAVSQSPSDGIPLVTVAESGDELALYEDLPVLENWELLSNFEVLQELETTTP